MEAIFIILLVAIGLFVSSFRLVRQTDMFVVERLGGYFKTWDTGIHLLIPFIDKVAKQVSMKEQIRDFPPQPVITKDNLTMQIDSVVFFQVTDPKLYAYGVNNPIAAIENLSATTLRNIIGDLDLEQTLTSRELINTKMRDILDEATDPWGIKVNRVEIKNIIPPRDIREALEKQLRAEREKRESVLLAEGQKRAEILKAEGEAEADGINLIKKAGADNAVLQIKSFEALAKVADGQSTKIVVPSNLMDLSSVVLAAKEIATNEPPKTPATPKKK